VPTQTKQTLEEKQLLKTLLYGPKAIKFSYDPTQESIVFKRLHGDLTLLNFPQVDEVPYEAMIAKIEPANPYTKIFAKTHYLNNLKEHITTLKEEKMFLVPFKNTPEPLWTMVKLVKINETLISGEIVYIYKQTPEQVMMFEKLHQDAGTKLFNREALKKHLDMIDTFDNHYGIFLDLDRFKSINDEHGHAVGDEVLKAVSELFMQSFNKDVIFYRLSGDEFFIKLENHTLDQTFRFIRGLLTKLSNLSINDLTIDLSASAGITQITKHSYTYQDVLKKSDDAMYQAKKLGRNRVAFIK